MNSAPSRKLLKDIFYSALKAVDPYESVLRYKEKILSEYQRGGYSRLIIVGFGKGAFYMGKAIEEGFGDLIEKGIVITKYGHSEKNPMKKIDVFEAGHPVPDENGLNATKKIIDLLNDADEKTLVVCLISGGGSALYISPLNDISLKEKQETTKLLLKSGATINELNAVRKHLSKVKGGRTVEIAYPAKIISLILSDVIGDNLDVIASGPTAPDETTYNDALSVIEKYGLTESIPQKVLDLFKQGRKGIIPDTPKKDSIMFEKVENIIIGSNKKALEAANKAALEAGIKTEILSSAISGEAKDIGKQLADNARDIKKSLKSPVCLLSGGETTVTVKGNGIGGRNMELALAFAIAAEGTDGITLLSAGTDGTDGPTDAAGAIVDGQTTLKAKDMGLDPQGFLVNNDSYSFFKKTDELFITGPTGTNVMDIQIVLIE